MLEVRNGFATFAVVFHTCDLQEARSKKLLLQILRAILIFVLFALTRSLRSCSKLHSTQNFKFLSRKEKFSVKPFSKGLSWVVAYASIRRVKPPSPAFACARYRSTAKSPFGRRSANGCSGRKRPRGKNYFAFSFWGEIILQAFPTGTLRPCKRGRSLSGSHIKLSAFHYGTPCCI